MDDLDSLSFSTAVLSYRDNVRVIMKGCLQWNLVTIEKIFAPSDNRKRNCTISRPAPKPLLYQFQKHSNEGPNLMPIWRKMI